MMDARVGVDRSLNSATSHGGVGVVDGSSRAYTTKATTAASQPRKQQSLHQQQSQIGTISQLLAGGIAGAVSKTCTAPLARLTILFQQTRGYLVTRSGKAVNFWFAFGVSSAAAVLQMRDVQGMHYDVSKMSKPCIWHEARRIISEEGFRAFWRGNLVTIAHRLPYSSVSFYAYERYKHLLQSIPGLESHRENVTADVCVRLLGGGLAGITAASATYPLDLVRTRLACQTNVIYYRGIGHTLSTIVREEGVLGLYKGLGATLLGVGPSIAISFSVYETLRSSWQLKRPQDSTIAVSLACGSLSGIASSTATFPLDLVRRRMQLEGAGGRARVYNTGIFGTFKQIMKQEGLRGLYRGILPEYYKVVPSVGIVFMTYEMMKILLAGPPKEA